jgi:hypothetical protein
MHNFSQNIFPSIPKFLRNEMVQGPCVNLRFLMLGQRDCGMSYDKCSIGMDD